MKNKLKKEFNKLNKTGFFSIFLSNSFAKVVTFLGAIILVRILSKDDYGVYAGVTNAISMLLLLNDFGVSSAALQFLTENSENEIKQKQIMNSALKIGIFASVLGSLLILFSPYFYPFTIDRVDKYTQMLFLIPLLNLVNGLIPVILRSNLENKKFAKLNFISTLINYAFLLPLTLIFGLVGAILSKYAYAIASFIYGLFLVKPYLKKLKGKDKLEKKEHREFLKFSLISQINNTVSGLLLVIDTFLIGYMIKSSDILATYKVATVIPHALTFLPSTIMVYILPYFVKHNKDKEWLKVNYLKVIKYCLLFFGIICLILILGSKLLFNILYGDKYMESVLAFNILIFGFFFSASLKTPCANIVYSLKKVKINMIVNLLAILINIVSNIVFINIFGFVGAAITTTLINILESLIYVIYINYLLRGDSNEKINN